MKRASQIILSIGVFGLVMALASSAAAFSCPNYFAEAKAAIAKAKGALKGLSGAKKAEAHILLDDAKMLLSSAIHNHEKPQGKLDHGRAIGKAGAAKGYAIAAYMRAQK
jgi:hypothetical protein